MTVLGLLIATFITQGQVFLPTLSTLFIINRETVQQGLIDRCLPSIAQISHQPKSCVLNHKYQKIPGVVENKIPRQGSDCSIESLQRKVAFSPVLKDYSMNAQSLTFDKSLRLAPQKWDIPQTTDYQREQRLLAQYYRGQQLPVLRYGHTGDAVRVLQTLLTYNRYGVGVTGRFDVLTETAVKAFQEHRRLGADGIVGARTWQELTRYAAFHTQRDRDPMELPMLGNQPLYPWEKRFVLNFAESAVSI